MASALERRAWRHVVSEYEREIADRTRIDAIAERERAREAARARFESMLTIMRAIVRYGWWRPGGGGW
jgi:hypothetical protein